MNKIFSVNNVIMFFMILLGIQLSRCNTNKHQCVDATHQVCDGECKCDGMECETKAYQIVPSRAYQLEFVEDSILIFDGHRYVGIIPCWDNSPLDSVLQKDNE